MRKLNKKHKSKVRRQVDIDLGVKPPKSIIFTSKKIYREDKLRLKLSILRMGKAMNQLNDSGEIELTICELLLESLTKNIKI